MGELRILEPTTALDAVIHNLQIDLQAYQRNKNANNYVVKKRLDLIEQLISISDNLHIYQNHAYITEIKEVIDNFLKVDKELESIIIRLNVKKPTNKIASVTINAYKDE